MPEPVIVLALSVNEVSDMLDALDKLAHVHIEAGDGAKAARVERLVTKVLMSGVSDLAAWPFGGGTSAT